MSSSPARVAIHVPAEALEQSGFDEKYVIGVMYPKDDSSNTNSKKIEVFAALGPHCRYHSDIVGNLSALYPEHLFMAGGGGLIKLQIEEDGTGVVKRRLLCYGKSGGFGKPNADMVARLLAHSESPFFEGWERTVTVTDFIRD